MDLMAAFASRRFGPSVPAPRPGRRLPSGARLLRLGRVLLAPAGAAAGAWLVAGPGLFQPPLAQPALFAALSVAIIAASASALGTARPSGLAWGLWAVGTGAGILLSGFVSAAHVAVALGASGLLYLFNVRLRLPPTWRPIGAGMAALLVVLYGGWAVGPSGTLFVGGAFVFLSVTAHQLIRGIEHARAAAQGRTKAEDEGARAATLVLGLAVGLSALPYLVLGYSGLYLLTACVADLLMLRTAYLLISKAPDSYATRARALLQGALVVGLAALALASV